MGSHTEIVKEIRPGKIVYIKYSIYNYVVYGVLYINDTKKAEAQRVRMLFVSSLTFTVYICVSAVYRHRIITNRGAKPCRLL